MKVLGIETSCDETGIAIYVTDQGIISQNVYSQVELHATYGGVVPELASRDHIQKTLPLIYQTLDDANIMQSGLDGVAFTAGPGLVGALLVGATIGRALAWSLGIPAIPVHHMEAHLLAPLLEKSELEFPFLALLVSGGHTMLVLATDFGDYEILGESLDDAAGEAFDKTAKLLGLGYPGGPEIARLAEEGRSGLFSFPRPMTDRPSLDFSFSGLKTAVQTTVNDISDMTDQIRCDIATAFEEAVVETLFIKCRRAVQEIGIKKLVMAGGVAANQRLRSRLSGLDCDVFYPPISLCTDNGAMIAFAGHEHLVHGRKTDLAIECRARWPINEITTD